MKQKISNSEQFGKMGRHNEVAELEKHYLCANTNPDKYRKNIMKKGLLAVLSLAAIGTLTAATRTADIVIDSRTTYQHVTGFGGFSPSPQWQYWLNDTEMDKLFGKGDNQLGLNILRLYIANNKNYWGSGVANAKRAKKYGAYVFASPWSPPASWKSNNSTSNGGALLESRYADWANFLNDYYKYMKQQGATIDAVSIQNEPDWNATYESCIWTGQQMANFLKNHGAKIECQIIAPEAIHFTRTMHEPILNDDAACAQLDILGGHFYGWDGSSYPLAAQKGKEVWMTEFLINERQQNNNININWKDDGFLFARSVNDAMLANMSAWVHYSLKRYYGCLGDGTYGTTNNAITKRGYILSHYAKYVSGTTRVRHSLSDASGKLTASAYVTASGDSVVVMVLNPSADTYNTTLTLPFNTLGGMQIVTTETLNVSKKTLTFDTEGYQPIVAIEPYSVNTYIYKKSSQRDDLPDSGQEEELIFADNFDLYGASCVPAGWKSKLDDGTMRTAGNYSSNSRVMGFSAEGAMQYAFYFRAGSSAAGYVCYGDDANYRLNLIPGKYTISYSLEGWKVKPSVTFQVLKAGVTPSFASQVAAPAYAISENGSSARITQTTDQELQFEVTESDFYVLRWVVPKSNGGLNEVLVGNIRLTRENTSSPIIQTESSEPSSTVFDLLGRPVTQTERGKIYMRNGRKFIAGSTFDLSCH